MESFIIEQGEGRCRIQMAVTLTGNGVNLFLTGGESPHVGGVVLCVPRASLTGEGTGADIWIIPVAGHKDVLVAQEVGAFICKALSEPVAVTAGIHSDGATADEITQISKNSLQAAVRVVEKWRCYS